MGMFDTVKGILPPYSNQLKIWECLGKEYQQHDKVPQVGLAASYSVKLCALEEGLPPRFLTVLNGEITNTMAHQPIMDSAVFDKWGSYLGRGEELGPFDQESAPNVRSSLTTKTHRFWLRDDFEVSLKLPSDISDNEVAKLTSFVSLLARGSNGICNCK